MASKLFARNITEPPSRNPALHPPLCMYLFVLYYNSWSLAKYQANQLSGCPNHSLTVATWASSSIVQYSTVFKLHTRLSGYLPIYYMQADSGH